MKHFSHRFGVCLAVAESFSGKGIGSAVLRFIRMWFLDEDNKTGCRFAIVDAKNEPQVN
jgi:GNAT superfamily N-acetyltransferase